MKITILGLLLLLLNGCSSVNPLSVISPKPQLEVNANVGKNVSQEKSLGKVEVTSSNQTADEISNDTTYDADVVNQITNNLTWWQMLMMIICAGAALPSFKEMYAGVKIIIGDILYCFIVYPIKNTSEFLLSMKSKS